MKFELKLKPFQWRKCILKCLQNGGHFVSLNCSKTFQAHNKEIIKSLRNWQQLFLQVTVGFLHKGPIMQKVFTSWHHRVLSPWQSEPCDNEETSGVAHLLTSLEQCLFNGCNAICILHSMMHVYPMVFLNHWKVSMVIADGLALI